MYLNFIDKIYLISFTHAGTYFIKLYGDDYNVIMCHMKIATTANKLGLFHHKVCIHNTSIVKFDS